MDLSHRSEYALVVVESEVSFVPVPGCFTGWAEPTNINLDYRDFIFVEPSGKAVEGTEVRLRRCEERRDANAFVPEEGFCNDASPNC